MNFINEIFDVLTGKKYKDMCAKDEPLGEFYLVPKFEWIGKIKPISNCNEYRIVKYDLRSFNKYGLESKVNGAWKTVQFYDDGYDDYGKLHSAKWEDLSDFCNWSINELERFKNALSGQEETQKPIE